MSGGADADWSPVWTRRVARHRVTRRARVQMPDLEVGPEAPRSGGVSAASPLSLSPHVPGAPRMTGLAWRAAATLAGLAAWCAGFYLRYLHVPRKRG